jgi:hypothetical protein
MFHEIPRKICNAKFLVKRCGKPVENSGGFVETLWILWGKPIAKIRIETSPERCPKSPFFGIKHYRALESETG